MCFNSCFGAVCFRKQSWCWVQGDAQRQRQKEKERSGSNQSYSHVLTAVDGMKIEDLLPTEDDNNNNEMEISDVPKGKVSCTLITSLMPASMCPVFAVSTCVFDN